VIFIWGNTESDIFPQVKHFDKRRVYEKYKKKLEEAGYQPLSENVEKTQ
jgi:hypothetical protein